MNQLVLQSIKKELQTALNTYSHPFRYFTCGTIASKTPKQRTVVLRAIEGDFKLIFYTDKRSAKVEQLRNNSTISALFYHPEKKIQLLFTGNATIVTETKELQKIWTQLSDKAKKDYTTKKAPGSTITPTDGIDYLSDRNFFCQVEIETTTLEYLKLTDSQHQRIEFTKQNDGWESQFLVP
ncbi:pyridoxamine 5'-phosphate oxidase family protein [Flavobacterium sp. ASW18X]|uniref:pyridoxamine 5'-phosphate oxidase family protein n=1 Tax=Flavobacterium sp. ASW18X TaxID=2572595 RepID=UPI00146D00BC|nr:pyridoxamine 5'-phosphate oxidase family protein [Flavobacterium sp. ASW18X]